MSRHLGLFALLLALVCATPLCGKDLTLVVIPKSEDQDYWKFVRRGVERAVQETGKVTLIWRGPAYNDDTEQQIKIVERYTAPETDAILICPTDRNLLVPSIQVAEEKGIPVIVFDSALAGHAFHGFVATNNREAGKIAARDLVEALGTKGEILVLRTTQGSDSTDQRAEGFVSELKLLAPEMKVVADVWGGGSMGKAFHSSLELLAQWPQPTAVFAVNESATAGMLQALGQRGLAGKIPFWGFDASPPLIEALDEGKIRGLVVQDPDSMGYQAVMMALEVLSTKTLKNPERWTDAVLVNRANRSQPRILKLLSPG